MQGEEFLGIKGREEAGADCRDERDAQLCPQSGGLLWRGEVTCLSLEEPKGMG